MTLSTTTTRVSFAGNGVTTTFAFSFRLWAASNLKVYWRDASGVETLKTLTTHYTIDIITYPNTGNVVFDVTAIPPSGTTVVLVRDMPLVEELDLIASGTFAAENMEIQLDKIVAQIQTLRERIGRGLVMPITTSLSDLALPEPTAAVANQVLGINTAGDGYELKTLSSAVTFSAFGLTLVDDADAAAARTTLGLGTIATAAAGDYLSAAAAAAAYQPLDAELTAIAGLTSAADRLPYFTGSGAAALATFTAAGRALVDDADAAAQRTTLGLGTMAVETASNYLTTAAAAAAYQPLDADLTTWAGLTPSANAQSLVTAADYSAMRTLLGLVIGTNVQAYDADLTTWAGITPSANVQSLVSAADYSAIRTLLGLVIGTNVQAYDAELAALAGLTSAADKLPYFTGSGTAAVADFTAAGRALVDDADATAQRATLGLVIGTNVQAYDAELAALAGLTSAADKLPYFTGSGTAAVADFTAAGRALVDDADASAQRTTLGLGTAATVNTGTSGATIPLLNVQNTWSANQLVTKASANTSIQATSGDATAYISAVSGSAATQRWSHYTGSGNSDRWLFGKDSTAESGSNVGSDFACYAYDDSGAFLHLVFTVQRSTGCFRFGKEIRVGGDVGGQASHTSFTNTSNVAANSTGVGTILFKGTTSRNSTGFIKIYIGTTAYYVPVFDAITG